MIKLKLHYKQKTSTTNTKLANEASMSFLKIPLDTIELAKTKKLVTRLRHQFDTLLVIGIGGSDLGARTLISALTPHYLPVAKQVLFAGDTSDATHLPELASIIDYKKTALLVISKSGETTETLATFAFFKQAFKKVLGEKHRHHIFALTSNSGTLFEIAQKENFEVINHYPVGGRFSVFSNVGLIPAGFAGIDIDALIKGVNSASRKTALQHALANFNSMKQGKNISLVFAYNASLEVFTKWYVQLWAESVGKNSKGSTPVRAIGPTDQHSLLQLLQDGPNDKFITFITTQETNSITVPALNHKSVDAVLAGKKFNSILYAQYEGTKQALIQAKRSCATLTLNKLDAKNLGALLMHYMLTTVYTAQLMKVNAFDQPGVEESKKITRKLLNS